MQGKTHHFRYLKLLVTVMVANEPVWGSDPLLKQQSWRWRHRQHPGKGGHIWKIFHITCHLRLFHEVIVLYIYIHNPEVCYKVCQPYPANLPWIWVSEDSYSEVGSTTLRDEGRNIWAVKATHKLTWPAGNPSISNRKILFKWWIFHSAMLV